MTKETYRDLMLCGSEEFDENLCEMLVDDSRVPLSPLEASRLAADLGEDVSLVEDFEGPNIMVCRSTVEFTKSHYSGEADA